MEQTAIIILREMVEIALILTVVLAATRGLPGRAPYIWGGLVLGIAGSALIAAFAERITLLAEGFGQEIMNAIILGLAALMIGWTVVWMRVHGRELSQRVKQVGDDIRAGDVSFLALTSIIALAIFREGSEIVLFSYGILASGTPWSEFVLGAAAGIVGGVVIGLLFYLGMIKLFAKYFFTVTTWLLAILAASLAAKAAHFLVNADILPDWGYAIWDTSDILSEDSFLGETLGVLIGYTAQPSGMQLAVYVATLVLIGIGLKVSQRQLDQRNEARQFRETAPTPTA